MPRNAWGIDISKTSIKAVLLEKDKESLTLARVDVEELPRGVGDQAQIDEHIKEGLGKLLGRNKIKGQILSVSIPGHTVFNRPIKLPPVADDKIAEVVRYEAQQQIPFPLNEVVWDYYVVDRKYGPGEEREVILFAIKRDVVDHHLGILTAVGLRPQIVQFSPVALYNFLVYDQEVGTASVALDFGAENTDLVVVDGPRCWIRNLPITGGDLTKAIQKGFNIPPGEAEKLKLSAAQSKQAAKIFGVLQPVLKDLVGEIHRSIGFYKSISRQSKFDRIFLTGNASKVVNFQKFASQNLQMLAARVERLGKVGLGGDVDANVLQKYLPALGPALGLALQAHGETRMKINLLPEEERLRREMARRKPVAAVAVALLALPVVFMGRSVRDEKGKLEALQARADEQLERYGKMLKEKAAAAYPIDFYVNELKTVSGLVAERDLPLKVMNEINAIVKSNPPDREPTTESLWLLSCEMTELPPAAPGAAAGGAPAGPRLLPPPAGSVLRVSVEGAVTKRDQVSEAQKFVKEKLGDPVGKAFLIEAGGDVDVESVAVPRLRPKWMDKAGGGAGGLADDNEPRYNRFTVVWNIKVGEEARKPKPPPAPAEGGGAPAQGGGGN